ncbi:L-rhamnose-binding lectin CSL3-like [Colossoma macropomum]|uniref:L-rhamnose-binding lectin CSL3-like n=1 Tax=Colossoma macropomum TaxID=42526 RepID=UPI001864F34D|nr:L-rhamnose-binding lectin CSL3-like [Colossoma macropomum]
MSWTTWMLFLMLCGGQRTSARQLACEDSNTVLSCGSGYIEVVKANYGRTDKITCSEGLSSFQLSYDHCYNERSLKIMSDRCDGRYSCVVLASNSVFSDPCYGIPKFLDVTYNCVSRRRIVVCEDQQDMITCESGVIFIHHANYGRRDLTICPLEGANLSNCYSPQTTNLSLRCNGKSYCKLRASNDVFSDPCYGIHKYLEVTYSCK